MSEYLIEVDVILPTDQDPEGDGVARLRQTFNSGEDIYDAFAELAFKADKQIKAYEIEKESA